MEENINIMLLELEKKKIQRMKLFKRHSCAISIFMVLADLCVSVLIYYVKYITAQCQSYFKPGRNWQVPRRLETKDQQDWSEFEFNQFALDFPSTTLLQYISKKKVESREAGNYNACMMPDDCNDF